MPISSAKINLIYLGNRFRRFLCPRGSFMEHRFRLFIQLNLA